MKKFTDYEFSGEIIADIMIEQDRRTATETTFAIPLGLIDLGRLLLAQPESLPLGTENEEWLDEKSIACTVSELPLWFRLAF